MGQFRKYTAKWRKRQWNGESKRFAPRLAQAELIPVYASLNYQNTRGCKERVGGGESKLNPEPHSWCKNMQMYISTTYSKGRLPAALILPCAISSFYSPVATDGK